MNTPFPIQKEIHINGRKIKSLKDDVIKTAKAVKLLYVSGEQKGIIRKKTKNGFEYFFGDKKITGTEELKRFKGLMIPPAWENTWICPKSNGHLQATGYDTRGRKQYKYHPAWVALRSKTKFYRLHDFGKALPRIRKKVREDLMLAGLPRKKILAALISLMEQTNIRIGNRFYEKLYGSFGLTTLKGRHVKLCGSSMRFVFTGKKGISHDISIRNKRLAKIVRKCKEIPGRNLFQYYDEDNDVQLITSGEVNEYIHDISGEEFTSKDFRTWQGSVECIRAFEQVGFDSDLSNIQKNKIAALDKTAQSMGNTRAVVKKYYIHPLVLNSYENGKLEKYTRLNIRNGKWMDREEKLLIKMLQSG